MALWPIDLDLSGNQLRERVAELLSSEHLFGEDARTFIALYQDLRIYLNILIGTLPTHSSHQVVRPLANWLYTEPEENEIANNLAMDIQRGRSSKPDLVPTPTNVYDGCKPHIEPPERLPHIVTMRLRDSKSKFYGDTIEDDYVDIYNQMTEDDRLSDKQKLQFLHNTLTGNPLRFYTVTVAPNVATY